MAKKWDALKKKMSPAAQERVDARVRATLASLPLAEIRKAIGLTQQELAGAIGTGQGSVSKIESAADLYLSTLRRYIESMGGTLILTASFPDGREFRIDSVKTLGAA